jgi:putative aldouronate transport system substrate-binding protein
MKKLVSLVLALCLALSLLSFASAEGVTTVRLYRHSYMTSLDEGAIQKVEDAINARLAELGSKVAIDIHEFMDSEYGQKGNNALLGQEVDLLWTANWYGTIGTNDLYASNGAKDLSALLPGTMLWESMPEWYWEAARYDGKDYYVPVYKEGAEGYMIKILESNAEKAGIDVAAMVADIEGQADTYARLKALEPYMEKAKEAGVKYPFIFAGTPMFYRFYLDKYDFVDQQLFSIIGVDQATNELINPIQTEDYKNFCLMMAEWGEKGYFNVDDEIGGVVSSATNQTQDWMLNWWTNVPNNEESEGRDGNQAESFMKVTENWGRSTTTLGSCYAIPAYVSDDIAAAAIEFLGYLFTDTKIADLYTYGIEGEDYILENGKVNFNADGITKLYHHDAWCSTSVKPLTLTVDEPDNKVAMYDDFNNAAKGTVASGFRPNKTAVEAAWSACAGVFDEYGKSLELGVYGSAEVESKIAEFQAALDAAGYQDVLAEYQKQYNEWKAAQ